MIQPYVFLSVLSERVINFLPLTFYLQCLVMPWKSVNLSEKTVKWGVIWDDGKLCSSILV